MGDYWENVRHKCTTLGAAIKAARIEADLVQSELVVRLDPHCQLTGWNVPYLSRLEAGMLIPTPDIGVLLTSWLAEQTPQDILQALQTPPTRSTDPETSHDAARTVTTETMRELHEWWLNHLLSVWRFDPDQLDIDGHPVGYHATDEGARRFLLASIKTSDSGFRTRRAELRHAGFVRDSGRRYPISTGRLAIAWELTPEGRAAIK